MPAETWRTPLRNHIDRLKRIRDGLRDALPRLAARHRTDYRNHCARLLEENLLFVRPPDEDAAKWAQRVHDLAQSVADKLVPHGEHFALMIYLSTQNLPPSGPLEDFLTLATVKEWVMAGRAGDSLGKHFTAEDFLRDDNHIAGLVYFTILRGKAEHTPAHLRKWIEEKSLDKFSAYLLPVLKAWHALISVLFRKDARRWVREIVAQK